jgi:hypothetical protein
MGGSKRAGASNVEEIGSVAHVRPEAFAFDAKHQHTNLIVGPDLATGQRANPVLVGGCGCGCSNSYVSFLDKTGIEQDTSADVSADIKPGPAEGRRWRRWRSLDGQISRKSGRSN